MNGEVGRVRLSSVGRTGMTLLLMVQDKPLPNQLLLNVTLQKCPSSMCSATPTTPQPWATLLSPLLKPKSAIPANPPPHNSGHSHSS